MKTVDIPMANCLFFFLRSLSTYKKLVKTIAQKCSVFAKASYSASDTFFLSGFSI